MSKLPIQDIYIYPVTSSWFGGVIKSKKASFLQPAKIFYCIISSPKSLSNQPSPLPLDKQKCLGPPFQNGKEYELLLNRYNIVVEQENVLWKQPYGDIYIYMGSRRAEEWMVTTK